MIGLLTRKERAIIEKLVPHTSVFALFSAAFHSNRSPNTLPLNKRSESHRNPSVRRLLQPQVWH